MVQTRGQRRATFAPFPDDDAQGERADNLAEARRRREPQYYDEVDGFLRCGQCNWHHNHCHCENPWSLADALSASDSSDSDSDSDRRSLSSLSSLDSHSGPDDDRYGYMGEPLDGGSYAGSEFSDDDIYADHSFPAHDHDDDSDFEARALHALGWGPAPSAGRVDKFERGTVLFMRRTLARGARAALLVTGFEAARLVVGAARARARAQRGARRVCRRARAAGAAGGRVHGGRVLPRAVDRAGEGAARAARRTFSERSRTLKAAACHTAMSYGTGSHCRVVLRGSCRQVGGPAPVPALGVHGREL